MLSLSVYVSLIFGRLAYSSSLVCKMHVVGYRARLERTGKRRKGFRRLAAGGTAKVLKKTYW